MILKKVKLFPFAGITNKEVVFTDGLNVISGPNEAGKSTIVRAILSAFFSTTKLTPASEKKFLDIILPVSGGDTVRVNVEFEVGGIEYRLEKCWGGTRSSVLHIGNDKSMSDQESVHKKVAELLKLNESTWKNILFTRQALLNKTMDDVQQTSEISTSFSDLLRGLVMMQGGISPDKLKSNLIAIIKEYYNTWDPTTNGPLGGRDINNKAINNVGKILGCYYKLEEVKRDLILCKAYEQEIDQIANNIDSINNKLINLDDFIKSNQEIVSDARIRQKLEGELLLIKSSIESMKKDQLNWPIVSARFDGNVIALLKLEEDIKVLKIELSIAEKKEKAVGNINRYNSIIELQAAVKKAENEFVNCKKVASPDLIAAKSHSAEIEAALIKLNAQQLKISVIAKRDFDGILTTGVSAPTEKSFISGEHLNIDAPGKFGFEDDNFILNVVSGNEDIQMLTEQIEKSNKRLIEVFDKYEVKDLLELKVLAESEITKLNEFETQKKSLNAVLGKDDICELKKQMDELNSLPSVRETSVLRTENEKKTEEKAKLSVNQDRDKELIDLFIARYTAIDQLNDLLLDKNTDLRAIENSIKQLKPLPVGVQSASNFVTYFDEQKNNYQDCKDQLNNLIIQKTTKEKEEPKSTSEELRQNLDLYQKEFDRVKLEGAAYKKILSNLEEILKKDAEAVFNPYYEKTKTFFSELTGGKYKSLIMQNIIPTAVNNGISNLTTNVLSQGTKDSLALALRLSMADYYLKDSKGFIVMDDPLTDMDITRQQFAAACIKEFAKHKQVIIFTCHDSHRQLYNGHSILLDDNAS